jgi:hypothetical protein
MAEAKATDGESRTEVLKDASFISFACMQVWA